MSLCLLEFQIFSWVFREFHLFFLVNISSVSRGCFKGPKSFLWVFHGFNFFSREYFEGLKFFLLGITWVLNFFSWISREQISEK